VAAAASPTGTEQSPFPSGGACRSSLFSSTATTEHLQQRPQICPPATAPIRRRPQKPAAAHLHPAAHRDTLTSESPATCRREEQKTKRRRQESRSKRGGRTETLLAFSFFLQMTVVVTAGRKRKGRRGWARSRCFQLLAVARGFTCRQWRWRVGRRAATVLAPRNPAEHCSGLQKVFPVNARLFWGCYL
jgi:hypothetical protein